MYRDRAVDAYKGVKVAWVCSPATHGRFRAFVVLKGAGFAPGTPSAKRSVGTRRAASMQDTLSEGTARAAQLAPSAVTASAVGGSATRRVVDRASPTKGGSSRSTRDRAAWRSRMNLARLKPDSRVVATQLSARSAPPLFDARADLRVVVDPRATKPAG